MAVEEFLFTGKCNLHAPSSILCEFSAQLRTLGYLVIYRSLVAVLCSFLTKLALFEIIYACCASMEASSDNVEHPRFNMLC